jgi:hypothetical protein
VLKWVGAVLCALILAVLGLSLSFQTLYVKADLSPPGTRRGTVVYFGCGEFVIAWDSNQANAPWECFKRFLQPSSWSDSYPYAGDLKTRLRYMFELPRLDSFRGARMALTVPLWPVLVICAAVTFLLWWRDRRFPVGHCHHCGYDLTGNLSGRCPECGHPVEDEAKATNTSRQ